MSIRVRYELVPWGGGGNPQSKLLRSRIEVKEWGTTIILRCWFKIIPAVVIADPNLILTTRDLVFKGNDYITRGLETFVKGKKWHWVWNWDGLSDEHRFRIRRVIWGVEREAPERYGYKDDRYYVMEALEEL